MILWYWFMSFNLFTTVVVFLSHLFKKDETTAKHMKQRSLQMAFHYGDAACWNIFISPFKKIIIVVIRACKNRSSHKVRLNWAVESLDSCADNFSAWIICKITTFCPHTNISDINSKSWKLLLFFFFLTLFGSLMQLVYSSPLLRQLARCSILFSTSAYFASQYYSKAVHGYAFK